MTIAAYGVEELDASTLEQVDGGGIGKAFVVWLAEQVIDNWGDIKDGVADGWNGTYR
ncbi:MAG TPA: hypothetical protein VFL93_02155 [Longimicrobiaceae bacterium]|nr:hypothetical protein [Longimicrobiaceae bacterium]